MSCRVWSKFEAKSANKVLKLRIQDCPKNRIKEAVAFYTKYISNEGLFSKLSGIGENPEALEECLEKNNKLAQDSAAHIIICCEDEDDDKVGEILGLSFTWLVEGANENLQKIMPKTKEVQKKNDLFDYLFKQYDPMQQLKVSRYYSDVGLVVHREFRRLGIATELFKARRLACLAHDVPATAALVTAIGSLKAAQKDNWETVLEVNLDDLSRQHGVTIDSSSFGKVVAWKKP